jgi:hypothetical protein
MSERPRQVFCVPQKNVVGRKVPCPLCGRTVYVFAMISRGARPQDVVLLSRHVANVRQRTVKILVAAEAATLIEA